MATAADFLETGPPLPNAPAPAPKKPQTTADFLANGPAPAEDTPQEPLSTTEKVLLTGARVVPPIVAGMVGGPLLSVPVGAATEYGAQKYEQHRGARKDISGTGVALGGVLSGIPGAKFESSRSSCRCASGGAVGEGGLIGGGATGVSRWPKKVARPPRMNGSWASELQRLLCSGGALEAATGAGRRHRGEVGPAVEGVAAESVTAPGAGSRRDCARISAGACGRHLNPASLSAVPPEGAGAARSGLRGAGHLRARAIPNACWRAAAVTASTRTP
jgi:hypothetical protein